MIEQDTIRLLRECDAGVKMGIQSIEEVQRSVRDRELAGSLERCRKGHIALEREIRDALIRFGDEGKDPDPVAEKMSWLKTNVKLMVDDSDKTIAELMMDGCHMGVKSLSRYLHQYRAAHEDVKKIAAKLIHEEKHLSEQMEHYL